MKDLLELIQTYAILWGIPNTYITRILVPFTVIVVTLGVVIIPTISMVWKLINYVILSRKQSILNRDLKDFYTPLDVEKATRYYVPTKYQNISPSEEEEPGKKHIAAAKNELIPLFLKEAFPIGKDNNKYYLILADSGMGKTTFLINLYVAYKNQWNVWGTPKYDIELFPLGSPKTFTAIQKIENPSNTILLLDAFDEDVEALHNYQKRLGELLELTKDFREIVITCRTQFFPTQKDEFYETGYFSYGDAGSRQYKFQKLYMSVFQDKDVKKYLHKRFPFYQYKKRKRAWKIAQKSPNLVMRPMLLSHIQDLLATDREYEFSFQVYEEMIEKWLDREADKPGLQQKYGSPAIYKERLRAFSQQLAIDMYYNKDKRKGYFVGKEEEYGKATAELVENNPNPEMNESERRSRSMLNRNAEGQYKFAHKSIMEYFLAKEMMRDLAFYKSFNFEGMEATALFKQEMLFAEIMKNEVTFVFGDGKGTMKIGQVSIFNTIFHAITALEIKKYSKENNYIHIFSRLEQLWRVIIYDKEQFPVLYDLYAYYHWGFHRQRPLHMLEYLVNRTLKTRLESGRYLHVFTPNEAKKFDKGQLALKDQVIQMDFMDDALRKQLLEVDAFFQEMEELKKHLPKACELIY